jgi:hypothetical protein
VNTRTYVIGERCVELSPGGKDGGTAGPFPIKLPSLIGPIPPLEVRDINARLSPHIHSSDSYAGRANTGAA